MSTICSSTSARGSCRYPTLVLLFSNIICIWLVPVKRIPCAEGLTTVVMVDRCYSFLDKNLNFTSLEWRRFKFRTFYQSLFYQGIFFEINVRTCTKKLITHSYSVYILHTSHLIGKSPVNLSEVFPILSLANEKYPTALRQPIVSDNCRVFSV